MKLSRRQLLVMMIGSKSKTYYVDTTGGNDSNSGLSTVAPWQTMNPKVNNFAFNPGDTILFKRGEAWTNSTTALNCSRAYVTYGAYGSGAAPIIQTTTSGSKAIIITADYVTLKNINAKSIANNAIEFYGYVTGAEGEGHHHCHLDGLNTTGPIEVYGSYNVVSNCVIDGTNNNGVSGNGLKESYEASHHNQYLNNTIHNFTSRGIWSMNKTHDCVFDGNVVYSITGGAFPMGIDLDAATTVNWRHIVRNNIVHDIAGDGIELENAWACLIEKNTVYNCTTKSGIYSILYSTCVLGGETNQYGVNGDARAHDSDETISTNLVYGCKNGIRLYYAGQVRVYFNTVTGCTEGAFRMQNAAECPNTEIKNNIFASTTSDGEVATQSILDSLAVDDHNLLFKSIGSTYMYLDYNAWTHMSLAQYQAAYPTKGVNSVQADPVFVSSSDWHLQVTSPAKGAGIAIVGITKDRDGVTRADPPDIGCYQYV